MVRWWPLGSVTENLSEAPAEFTPYGLGERLVMLGWRVGMRWLMEGHVPVSPPPLLLFSPKHTPLRTRVLKKKASKKNLFKKMV